MSKTQKKKKIESLQVYCGAPDLDSVNYAVILPTLLFKSH